MPLELYQRDGVWWYRGRPADGAGYVRRSTKTHDREIAEAEVRSVEGAARKRRILGPDAPKPQDEVTFSHCVVISADIRGADKFLVPIIAKIGAMKVKDITPQFVRKLARDLYPLASTDTWQRQVVTPVRSVINIAHDAGLCAPIRIKAFSRDERMRQDRVRGKDSRVARTPGSWPWLEAFKAHADPRDAALAHFMFRHGARLGQSTAMTVDDDMDLGRRRVRLPATKGHPAEWIALDPEEVAMIANLKRPARSSARNRVFGIGDKNGAMHRRWKAACERARIEYLPPHAAGRHGFGTEMLVRQKVSVANAAREGRWASPAVMLKTYAHAEESGTSVREAFQKGQTGNSTQPVQPGSANSPKILSAKRK